MPRSIRFLILTGALVGVLSGCSDGGPTAVSPIDSIPMDPATAEALRLPVIDARTRLQPGILVPAVASALAGHLSALETGIETLNREEVERSVLDAAQLLAGYAVAGTHEDAPDVAAIRLMLVYATQLLGLPLAPALPL